ncbi:MAG: hypothetical protein ACOCRN_01065 [Spirochaetia bacterium]
MAPAAKNLAPARSPLAPARSLLAFARLALLVGLSIMVPAAAHADLSIEADRWESVFAEGRERTVLSGGASVRSERIDVSAETIELSGTDYRYVTAEGDLQIEELEQNLRLTGGSLFVDRERDLIRVEGNAELQDRENELIVRGGLIEYQGEQEIIVVQIGVRILREDLVARSEYARYIRSEDMLELSGLPEIVWREDEYRAARIVIDLDTDEISLRGDVRADLRAGEDGEDGTPDGEADTTDEETDAPDGEPDGEPDAPDVEPDGEPDAPDDEDE